MLKTGLALSGVMLTLLIGKRYGAADLANFSLIQSMSIVVATIALCGTNESLVYYGAKYPGRAKAYLASSAVVFVVICIFLFIAARVISDKYHLFGAGQAAEWLFMTIPIGLLMLKVGYERGKENFYTALFSEPAMVSLLCVPIVFYSAYGRLEYSVVYIYIWCSWAVLLLSCLRSLVGFKVSVFRVISSGNGALDYFKDSLKYAVFGLVGMATSYVTIIIASTSLSDMDLASLKVAQQLAVVVGFSVILGNYILPVRFMRFFERQDVSSMERLAKKSALAMLGMALVPFIFFVIVGDFVFSFLNLKKDGYGFLVLILLGQVINAGSGSVMTILKMTGNAGVASILSIISAVLYIASLLLLAPLGLIGIGCAMVAFFIMQNGLAVLSIKRLVGFYPIGFVRK